MISTPNLDIAREQITERRGITGGRWYKADGVDDLLDGLTERLAAVMGELEHVRQAYDRLAGVEHARRHGALPSATATDRLDPDRIEWRIRDQDAVDQLLDDAARQAADIINDARQHYLVTAERAGWRTPDADSARVDEANARADLAEARLRDVGVFLEQWTRFLIECDAAERRAAAQRSDDLAAARRAAAGLLGEATGSPQHRGGGT